MLCTNAHYNVDNARFCSMCGVSTFVPESVGAASTRRARVNPLAVASLVCSLVPLFLVGSTAALVLGVIARRQIKQNADAGAGLALAGIIIGSVYLALFVAGVLAVVVIIAFFPGHCVQKAPNYRVCT